MNRPLLLFICLFALTQSAIAQCMGNSSIIGVRSTFDLSNFDFNKAFQDDVLSELPKGWQEPKGEKNIRYRYTLAGPVDVAFQPNQQYPMKLSMDLKFSGSVGKWVVIRIFGKKIKENYVDIDATGKLHVDANVGLTLDQDYKLIPQVDFSRFNLDVTAAGFEFDLGSKEIKKFLEDYIEKNLDKWIKPSVKLNSAWDKLNTTVDADNGYFLHLNPEFWTLKDISGDSDNNKILHFYTALQAKPELNNDPKDGTTPKPTTFGLPNNVAPGESWCLGVTAVSDYTTINTLIEKTFAGKPLPADIKLKKKKFATYFITGTQLRGIDNNRLELTVNYKKKPKKRKMKTLVYTATPVVDVPQQVLVLTELRNQKTPRSVAEFALAVITLFQRDFRVNLKDKVDNAKSKLQEQLTSKKPGFELDGKVETLRFIGTKVGKEELTLEGSGGGTIAAKIIIAN